MKGCVEYETSDWWPGKLSAGGWWLPSAQCPDHKSSVNWNVGLEIGTHEVWDQ